MERSKKLPRWLMILCAVGIPSLLVLAAPEVQAKSSVSKEDRAQLIEEITMQAAAALPYEDARFGPMEKLTVRGKMPRMWRVELIAPTSWRTSRLQAKIFDVEQPDRPAAFAQVSFTVEVPVYKALTRVESGEALTKELFSHDYVSLYDVPHDAITSGEEIVDKIARRALVPGKIVSRGMLDDPVLFKRGEVVKIKVRRGSVELVDSGLALETGKLGHTVRVKSTSTDAVLTGVVSREGVIF